MKEKDMGYYPTLREALTLCDLAGGSYMLRDIADRPWYIPTYYAPGMVEPPLALLEERVVKIEMSLRGSPKFCFVIDLKDSGFLSDPKRGIVEAAKNNGQ